MNATRLTGISALVVLALSGGLTVTAAPAAKSATVADLTTQMATALGFDAATPAESRRTLLAAGIDLGADLDAPLTRERAAHLLAKLGTLAGPPAEPGATLSLNAAGQVARTAAEWIMVGRATSIPTPEIVINGSCFTLPRNECVPCCVQDGMDDVNFPRTLTRYCGRLCQEAAQNPSPSTP